MPPREPGVSLPTLREAVQRAVTASSERQVALEIGISRQAVHGLLTGREPYGPTLVKLREWYGGEANELIRLRQENAELKRKLAECEKRRAR